ncbi:N-acetylglucosamine-6-phosphate deacetylase [Bacillus kexueae]|uniref:N-acetylglucosamine-6-phosphate deacetylase n=1 Tax=Aeribacillus kexueae TaxID=2078952 RepID=UPI001FAF43DE|nr:N-acetylglucosamine-6-phosphate deacetylase [Bacillus kexueae]
MEKIALLHATIYGEKDVIENGFLSIRNGQIEHIGEYDSPLPFQHGKIVHLPSTYKVIPGRIDVHIHGANGADVMDATHDALETMATSLPKEGTTSFLATTMTQSTKAIEDAVSNVASYIKKKKNVPQADILGIHLEGPFLNPEKTGAQPSEHLLDPSLSLFDHWQRVADGRIKLVTVAPELRGGLEFIRHLQNNGVVASIGHTNATNEEVTKAIQAGATHVTHLFNGMRGLHHRDPGTAGTALLRDELKVEVIADGIHVHPEMLNLTYQVKSSDKIILITDSMRAKCLRNGTYELGGQTVSVQDGEARLFDGTLAGSVLTMNDAVLNMMKYTECTLEESIVMSSVNPAKQLGLFHQIGSLKEGKDADIVILDEQNDVFMTICKGKIAYQKEEF